MKHRNHLIGALGLAAGAALIAPSIAGATTSSITANCAEVAFTYRDFGVGGQARPVFTIVVDGVTQAGTLEPPSGPLTVRTVPLNLQGVHTVAASTEGRPGINAFSSFGPATFNCPAPPPPPVEIFPIPGPGPFPPQPEARELTCAEKLALYPKAGPKTRKAWGCFVPKTKPPKRDTPVKPRKPVCKPPKLLIGFRRKGEVVWTCRRLAPPPARHVPVAG